MALSLNRSAIVRIAPFAAFMALLALRGALPAADPAVLPTALATGLSADGVSALDPRWIYALTVPVVGGLLVWFWRDYGEFVPQLRPSAGEAMLAVGVGLGVFALWIRLDAPWMTIGSPSAGFVPTDVVGRVDPLLVAVRWLGAALIVPMMEELFWRSFLMRWVADARFESVAPRRVGLKAVVLSTFVFMLAHTLWLAAIVAGLAYAWLYIRSGKLWMPVIAHAVTNGVLGVWVIATGNWAFW